MPARRSGRWTATAARLALAAALLAVVAPPASAIAGGFRTLVGAPSDDDVAAWAAQPSDASGNPDGRTRFELDADPGATLTEHVLITNSSTEEREFAVYGADAFNTSTGGYDVLAAAEVSTDVGSWVSVEAPTVTIPALSTAVVPFTVTVPDAATPGDHPGGVVVSPVRLQEADNGVVVDTRIAVRLAVRVAGEIAPALEVRGLSASFAGSWVPFGSAPATITYEVVNTGNVMVTGEPRIRVTGPFGVTLAEVDADETRQVLPGDSFTVTTELADVEPLVLNTAIVDVTMAFAESRVDDDTGTDDAGTDEAGTDDAGTDEAGTEPGADEPADADQVTKGAVDPAPDGVDGGDGGLVSVTDRTTFVAIPWTGLALVVLLAGGLWYLVRYLRWRRRTGAEAWERMVDEAAQARAGAATPGPVGSALAVAAAAVTLAAAGLVAGAPTASAQTPVDDDGGSITVSVPKPSATATPTPTPTSSSTPRATTRPPRTSTPTPDPSAPVEEPADDDDAGAPPTVDPPDRDPDLVWSSSERGGLTPLQWTLAGVAAASGGGAVGAWLLRRNGGAGA